MTAYIKFQSVLKKLEDKGYVKVRLVNDYWHYVKIICEQYSVADKLQEYLNEIDNEYKDNIYYQNFLLTSRINRQKLLNKLQSGSTKKINYQ